jgi:lincosamide and streptogramin A transport system ATP-binding/permease protein
MSIIRVTDLSFVHDGSFEPVFEHVSVCLDTDWRLGLSGETQAGENHVFKAAHGRNTPIREKLTHPCAI